MKEEGKGRRREKHKKDYKNKEIRKKDKKQREKETNIGSCVSVTSCFVFAVIL